MVACVIALVMSYIAWLHGFHIDIPNHGILASDFMKGWSDSLTLFGVNFIFLLACSVLMISLNKHFMFMEGVSALYSSLFILFVACIPQLSARWNEGSGVAFGILCCNLVLFSLYEQRKCTNRIFLLAAILSALSLWQVAFVYYVPLFLVGLIQMRVFTGRGLLAFIFGLITPYWIALGLGIVEPSELQYPQLQPFSIFREFPVYSYMVLGMLFLGLIFMASIFFTLMKYKLQIRAYNGFITLLLFWSFIMMVVDNVNALAYFPIFIATVSIQISHFFSTNNFKRRYIFLLIIFAIIGFNYIWAI